MSLLLQLTTLDLAPADVSWLADDERARLAGISDASRAAQFVAGHCLARRLAAEGSGGSETQWRLVVDPDGRRRLEHARLAPLYTSISHAHNRLVVAVGPRPMGVDLEAPGRARDWRALARTVFSPQEVRELEAVPDDRLASAFQTTWTLKEAWAKRSGLGLQRSTARRCTALACEAAQAEAWTWSLPDGGCLAVAASVGTVVQARGVDGQATPWRYREAGG